MSVVRNLAPFGLVLASLVACGTFIGLPGDEATLSDEGGVASADGGNDADACGTDVFCLAKRCPSGEAYCPITDKCVNGCANFTGGGGCGTSPQSYAIQDCLACPGGGAPVHVCTNPQSGIGGACATGTQPRCACTYCPMDDTHLCLSNACYTCGEPGTGGQQCLADSTCNTGERRCCGGC